MSYTSVKKLDRVSNSTKPVWMSLKNSEIIRRVLTGNGLKKKILSESERSFTNLKEY